VAKSWPRKYFVCPSSGDDVGGLRICVSVCPSSGDEIGESKNSGLKIICLDGVLFKKMKFWATEEVSAYSRDGRDMSYHGLS